MEVQKCNIKTKSAKLDGITKSNFHLVVQADFQSGIVL